MNEELLACQILLFSSFDTKQIFEETLNRMFLETPDINNDLLEMECRSIPDAMAYLAEHFDYQNLNQELLQKYLILLLKKFYAELPFEVFAGKIAGLWEVLPFSTNHEDSPFYLAYYYGDLLSAGKTELLKEDIEALLSYYHKAKKSP